MYKATGAAVVALLIAVLCAPPALAAKTIEWWRVGTDRPTPEPPRPTTGAAAGETTGAGTTESGGTSEAPTADPEAERLAEVLRQAGARSGLTLKGEVTALSGEALNGPAAEPEPTTTGAEAPAPLTAAALGSTQLPGLLADEAVSDYSVVALAAAEFTHPKGQTVRAGLVEMSSAADAWGLFSRNRGDEPLQSIGQAANFGHGLRVWKGHYTIIVAGEPPDPVTDKARFTKLGRDIATLLQGSGSPPTMIGWLPTTGQLPYTVEYFHADAPIGASSLALSPETEGVAAEYQVDEASYGALVVRYPDDQAALAGWAAFVQTRLGMDPKEGTPGTRRVGLEAGRWNGVRMTGRVCAFVVGAMTRNQVETLLAQAAGRAQG